MVESPQKLVREYRLPQIPIWFKVSDVPLSEEKADPIALHDILGSVFIYLGGMSLSCASFVLEVIAKALMRSVENLNEKKSPDAYIEGNGSPVGVE